MTIQKVYNPAADILRVIAILAVILIHTTTKTLEVTHYDLVHTPWTLFLNQISRFAVPLFFMISGFVLELSHPKSINYFTYLYKRLNRIVIPYLLWSVFYFLFVYPHPGSPFLPVILYGSASHQLYFIPTLLVFYLVFPLLHHFYSIVSQKWLLIILALIQIYFLYQDYYFHHIGFNLPYPLVIALFNYFPFIIGIVASHQTEKITVFVKKFLFLFITGTITLSVYVATQGYLQYYKTYNYQAFYSQWRPSVLLYTLLFSGLFFYLFSQPRFTKSFFKTLSGLSFFVFFIHVVVLEILWNQIFLPLMQLTSNHIAQNSFFDPLFFITTTFISFTIAYLIHRLPFIPRLTG